MGGTHGSLLLRGSRALATHDSSIRRSWYELQQVSADAGVLERLDFLDLPGLELKEVIRSSAKLLAFVRSYLKEVHGVLEVLAELKAGSAKAEANLVVVDAAISLFDEEGKIKKASKKRKKSKKYVQALEKFMQADDPLTGVELECQKLRTASEKLQAMMADLRKRKDELGSRLASIKRWRKVWKAAYTAAVLLALAVSVALAAAALPPAAIAGATAIATSMKAIEQWFDTMWDDKERGLKEERKAAKMMKAALLEVQDLKSIPALAEKVSADIGTVRDLAQFPLTGDAVAVKVAMEAMRRKTTEVEGGIRVLKLKVNLCEAEVKKVAVQFRENISK